MVQAFMVSDEVGVVLGESMDGGAGKVHIIMWKESVPQCSENCH